jgi:hypothetical protein
MTVFKSPTNIGQVGNPIEVEWLWVVQTTHNNYTISCHSVYYAHVLSSCKHPIT